MPIRFCVVYVTAPRAAAGKIAQGVLKDRLVACVNVVPGVTSYYWWKGKREKGRESLLIIKTRHSLLARLEARVTALHPSTVPEIISLPIVKGNRPYLAWLARETR